MRYLQASGTDGRSVVFELHAVGRADFFGSVDTQPENTRFPTATGLHSKQIQPGSSTMADANPQSTFRGLPLTPEQDAEIRHYIKRKKQHGEPWDTPELKAMLEDMLSPPDNENGEPGATVDETRAATERATASIDEDMEPIEASEERNAAMETEGMKGPKR
jgi:hypothetical protein